MTRTSRPMAARPDGDPERGNVTRRGGVRRRAVPVTAVLAALVLVAGCSAAAEDASDDSADMAAEEQAAETIAAMEGGDDSGAEAEEAADEDASGGAAAPESDQAGGVQAAPAGRRVVTSTLTIATDDVANAAADARDLAVRAGGFVATETTSGGEQPSATLRLRVPVDRAGDVVDDLAGLGDEVYREVESEDVESRLVDLESRVATARASIARVRDLLDRAEDLEDVVLLEGELTRRQADYESLEAQRAALADLAQLATVTVTFSTPEEAELVAAAGTPGFLGGLEAGWGALVATTAVVLTVLGAVLPFAVVLAAGGAVVWALVIGLRARGRRRSPA